MIDDLYVGGLIVMMFWCTKQKNVVSLSVVALFFFVQTPKVAKVWWLFYEDYDWHEPTGNYREETKKKQMRDQQLSQVNGRFFFYVELLI